MAPATSAYSHSESLIQRLICQCVLSANSKPEASIAFAPGRSDGARSESWPNVAELIHLPHDCEKQGRSLNCGNAKKWMKPVEQSAWRRDRGRGCEGGLHWAVTDLDVMGGWLQRRMNSIGWILQPSRMTGSKAGAGGV